MQMLRRVGLCGGALFANHSSHFSQAPPLKFDVVALSCHDTVIRHVEVTPSEQDATVRVHVTWRSTRPILS